MARVLGRVRAAQAPQTKGPSEFRRALNWVQGLDLNQRPSGYEAALQAAMLTLAHSEEWVPELVFCGTFCGGVGRCRWVSFDVGDHDPWMCRVRGADNSRAWTVASARGCNRRRSLIAGV